MTTNLTARQRTTATQRLWTVAIVSHRPEQRLLDEVWRNGHCAVFVEWDDHTYSNLKRVEPDLIVVCMSHDDVDGCLVLSMLKLDQATARIPVVTCLTAPRQQQAEDPTTDILSSDAAPLRVSLN